MMTWSPSYQIDHQVTRPQSTDRRSSLSKLWLRRVQKTLPHHICAIRPFWEPVSVTVRKSCAKVSNNNHHQTIIWVWAWRRKCPTGSNEWRWSWNNRAQNLRHRPFWRARLMVMGSWVQRLWCRPRVWAICTRISSKNWWVRAGIMPWVRWSRMRMSIMMMRLCSLAHPLMILQPPWVPFWQRSVQMKIATGSLSISRALKKRNSNLTCYRACLINSVSRSVRYLKLLRKRRKVSHQRSAKC